jgi:uncharacterized protein (DUF1778 family)
MAKKRIKSMKLSEQGKSLIWAPVDDQQKKTIRMAAAIEGLPMSQFLVAHGLAAAEKILEKMKYSA